MTKSTRRQFAKLAAALPLATVELAAQPKAPVEKAPSKFAEVLTAVVRAEFEPHLTEEDLARIRRDFETLEPAIKRLREVPLVNSDEPDFTFLARVTR